MVDTSIPPMMVVPMEWRPSCPAPLAKANGNTPRMNANEVIRIGRKRSSAASMAASMIERPCRRNCSANSTMRIAFFAASPISMTRPIWQ